jgi:hypothetical protein
MPLRPISFLAGAAGAQRGLEIQAAFHTWQQLHIWDKVLSMKFHLTKDI